MGDKSTTGLRFAVLISSTGTGTNLKAIIDTGVPIIAVVSDTGKALGLEHARKHDLPIEICPQKEQLLPLLQKLNPDYICMAGWKQIITDDVIINYELRIMNLHPGLIPDTVDDAVMCPDSSKGLWNRGMLTTKAIQNFLDQRATYAGSSIHFLTLEFDSGPVLGRCFEKIRDDDTVESLYERLKVKENQLWGNVFSSLAAGDGSTR